MDELVQKRTAAAQEQCERVREVLTPLGACLKHGGCRGVMLTIDWGDGTVDAWLDADEESPLNDEADAEEEEAKRLGKWRDD